MTPDQEKIDQLQTLLDLNQSGGWIEYKKVNQSAILVTKSDGLYCFRLCPHDYKDYENSVVYDVSYDTLEECVDMALYIAEDMVWRVSDGS